ERPGDGDLDCVVRVGAQKLQVPQLDGSSPPDWTDDPRDRIRVAGPVDRRARVIDVHTVERGRKAIRVALAANLPVRDDVAARPPLSTGAAPPNPRPCAGRRSPDPGCASSGRGGLCLRKASGACHRRWIRGRLTVNSILMQTATPGPPAVIGAPVPRAEGPDK